MGSDDEFEKLLIDFLEPEAVPNPDFLNIRIEFVRDNHDYGSLHMWENHQVTEQDVLEVIFEIPPAVEARRDPDHPGRKLFLGATRKRRQLLVVCDVERHGKTTVLVPITAFDADEKEWRKK
jgi:hypothetical protein